jgi:uncharacterized protein (TIGR00369 family)
MSAGEDARAWLARLLAATLPRRDLMGVEVQGATDAGVVLRYRFDPSWEGPGGIVSGPATLAIADTAVYAAAQFQLGPERVAVVAAVNVRFARPARSAAILAEASVRSRSGNRLAVTARLSHGAGDPPFLTAEADCAAIRPPEGFPSID